MPAPIVLAMCCTIAGSVSAASGAPVAGSRIVVDGAPRAAATTDARGDFAVVAPPGTHRISASARGYTPVTVAVDARHDLRVTLALEPLDSPQLRRIGGATVDGRLAPIVGTVPSVTVTRADMTELGDDRIVDGLATLPSLTFARPDGGGANAISVVALRGPDPSESLLALDGQLLNDGNTGDLDLSRLPVAAFSAIDVTEGLGPQDSNGSNTFGGAIDLVSLRPTAVPHEAASYSVGDFGRTEAWFNATGTVGKLGYATALDDQQASGFISQTVPLHSTSDPSCAPCATHLGSDVGARSGLGNLTYTFSPDAAVTARYFVLGDARDQSSSLSGIDLNAADAGMPQYGGFTGPGDQTFSQTLRAYQLRGRGPLGAGELTGELSKSDDDVAIDGGSGSPYDIDHDDQREDLSLAWQRTFATSEFAFGGYARHEALTFDAPAGPPPVLGQSIATFFLRGGFDPIAKLRLDAGAYESHYSTFGSTLDGRFGAIYSADAATSVRLSIGTGFRAPLLAERYAFPYAQLQLDGNNVFLGQGSPNERPEQATEYELGASRRLTRDSTVDVSLYRTNLRDPVEIFYPLAAVAAGTCTHNSYANPNPACVSYNSNVGNAVYEGVEAAFTQRVAPAHLVLTARYGLNVAYPRDLDAQFANPTSGGTLVDDEQFLGIPQQQASLETAYAYRGYHAAADAIVRGNDNELMRPPFTIVNALVGRELDGGVDLSLAATNLFNVAAGRFTMFGAGQPYRGIVGQTASGAPTYGPLPTDELSIEPIGLRLILTIRR